MGGVTRLAGLRGIKGRGTPSVWATGMVPPITATQGTDTTPVVTEGYLSAIYVPVNSVLTGVSLLNGTAVAGSVIVSLYDELGRLVANSAVAGTAQAGIAVLQDIPFTAAYEAIGPATMYVGASFNNVAARFRTHTVGRFPAQKLTAQVFGTLANFTPATTFTTAQAPVATTY